MTLTARTIKTNSLTAAGTSGAATDALGSSATLLLAQGSQGALAVISGTFSATLQFEAQGSGGTWFAAPAVPIGTTGGALVSSATAAGNWLILAAGALQVRVRCSTYVSGTAVVELSNAPVGGFNAPITGTATGTNAQQVQGTAAAGAAVAGNPVLTGGKDTAGNAQYPLMDTSGRTIVAATSSDGAAATQLRAFGTTADGVSNNHPGLVILAELHAHNEAATSAWDRWRNNTVVTAFASAARTSTPTAVNITNYNARGLALFVDVTAGAVALSLTPSITLRDTIGATAFTLWTAAAAITSISAARYVYLLYPGSASAGSWTESVQIALPRQLTINMTHGNANSATYSVTCHHLV